MLELMISQAVILCGGSGTRMRDAGYLEPKFLQPLAGNSIAYYMLRNLTQSGVESIHLLLGENSDRILQSLPSLKKEFGLNINFTIETKPRGTGGALLSSLESLDEEFLLLHGDLLINTNLSEILSIFDTTDADFAQIVHPSTHVFDSDLVVTNNQNSIIGYKTKPHTSELTVRNLGNAGIYAFKKEVFSDLEYIEQKIDLDRDLLPALVNKLSKGVAVRNREFIRDIGTPERLEKTMANFGEFESAKSAKPAVFLDRDGTINILNGFISTSEDMQLIEDVGASIHDLNKAGFLVIVITNQSVVARGEATLETLNTIHARMEMALAEYSAIVNEIYYCPHHPDSGYAGEIKELKIQCECRKPKKGLIDRACADFHIDLDKSWMIGDSWRDMELARNARIQGLRVGTGEDQNLNHDFPTLREAVNYIITSSSTV